MPAPIPYPAPCSMTVADASKWFRASVPQIPQALEQDLDPLDYLLGVWELKSRLRLAAALALYDQELVEKFFANFPLPSIDTLLEQATAAAPNGDEQEDLPERAAATLFTFTLEQERAFPGTVGEAIGLECWDGQQTHVMTENGWQIKT